MGLGKYIRFVSKKKKNGKKVCAELWQRILALLEVAARFVSFFFAKITFKDSVYYCHKTYQPNRPFHNCKITRSGDRRIFYVRNVVRPILKLQSREKCRPGRESFVGKSILRVAVSMDIFCLFCSEKRKNPTDLFTILKLQNPLCDVSKLHTIRRSFDREAVNLWKGLSGWEKER